MVEQPSFPLPPAADTDETTGRYIITFRDEAVTEGVATLNRVAGIANLARADDFSGSAVDPAQLEAAVGTVFPTLGMAVVTLDNAELNGIMTARAENGAILDIEPERIFYALGQEVTLPLQYLKGYRDAVEHLYTSVTERPATAEIEPLETYTDDLQSTWGLKATNVVKSRYSGRGLRVAVLDTGFDFQHPDFNGRQIVGQSFVSGQSAQDGHGHGTHCIGTACGYKDVQGRRYGVAYETAIFVGKVLSNSGSGSTGGILAGIEWAIVNQCRVISMSLGNTLPTPSTAYEVVGQRALARGSLIVAAAGNHGGSGGTVGQPANSASIMAVAAVNNQLQKAPFSAFSGTAIGANVDIAGPGVNVYSSLPMPRRYGNFSGTSMATPHVAGIAALLAQAYGASGWHLWALLMAFARRLPLSTIEVGAGLVQAQ